MPLNVIESEEGDLLGEVFCAAVSRVTVQYREDMKTQGGNITVNEGGVFSCTFQDTKAFH